MNDGDVYVDDMGELVVLIHPGDVKFPKALAITGDFAGETRPWGESNGLLHAVFVFNISSVAIERLARRTVQQPGNGGEKMEAFEEQIERQTESVGQAIAKSLHDPFDYSLKLVTGEVIRYEEATNLGNWLHLSRAYVQDPEPGQQGSVNKEGHFHRGIDVQIAHIVWAKDAPDGS